MNIHIKHESLRYFEILEDKDKNLAESKLFWKAYNNYKLSAEKRKKKFLLTFEDFLAKVTKECWYCGIEPYNTLSNTSKKNPITIFYSGIDRVNSRDDYHYENVVSCCKFCNTLKGTMSSDRWGDFLNGVVRSHADYYEDYGVLPFPDVPIMKDRGSVWKGF